MLVQRGTGGVVALMRRANKRGMWPAAQRLAGLLAPEGTLAQAVGEGYAVAQAADTRARQATLALYCAYGAYGLAAAATAHGHEHGGGPAPVLRRLIAMLPSRYQRAASAKVGEVAEDGSASPGVARCAVQYLAMYTTSRAQVEHHAAHLVAADRLRRERARAERQRAADTAGVLRRASRGYTTIWPLAWALAVGAAAACAAFVVRLHP